jgi:hypothetical protein
MFVIQSWNPKFSLVLTHILTHPYTPHTHTHTRTPSHAPLQLHTHTPTHIIPHTHTPAHTIPTHSHTYTHTHISPKHTHTHTHTHTPPHTHTTHSSAFPSIAGCNIILDQWQRWYCSKMRLKWKVRLIPVLISANKILSLEPSWSLFFPLLPILQLSFVLFCTVLFLYMKFCSLTFPSVSANHCPLVAF